jgi:septal ring factor EnvC (AmiA/AmiB activator)
MFNVKAPFLLGGVFYIPGDPDTGIVELSDGQYRELGADFAAQHLGPLDRLEHQQVVRGRFERAIEEAEARLDPQKKAIAALDAERKRAIASYAARLEQARDDLKHLDGLAQEARQALADFEQKINPPAQPDKGKKGAGK